MCSMQSFPLCGMCVFPTPACHHYIQPQNLLDTLTSERMICAAIELGDILFIQFSLVSSGQGWREIFTLYCTWVLQYFHLNDNYEDVSTFWPRDLCSSSSSHRQFAASLERSIMWCQWARRCWYCSLYLEHHVIIRRKIDVGLMSAPLHLSYGGIKPWHFSHCRLF